MRYYCRRWYPYQRGRRSAVSAGRTSASTSYTQSLQFVRNEFFCFDQFHFERFLHLYGRKHGEGARQYLRRTYPSWKSGTTKTSVQTERRILACVPPILDENKQFELLSFQIPAVIEQQKIELKAQSIQTSTMETTYHSLANRIVEREYKLDWFVNEAFESEEVSEFLKIFKYTMLDCLRQSFRQVREDLMIMHDAIPRLDGSVDISYQIDLLGCRLEVDAYPPPGSPYLNIPMPEPRLVTQFKGRYRAILLEHALNQCKVEAMEHANRQVGLADIQAVVRQLQQTESEQEYDSTLEVQGQGGILRIRMQKKNLNRLRYAVAKQTFILLITVSTTATIVFWLCIKGLWPILFYVGMIPLALMGSIWSKLKETKAEIIEYERKRATWFTAS